MSDKIGCGASHFMDSGETTRWPIEFHLPYAEPCVLHFSMLHVNQHAGVGGRLSDIKKKKNKRPVYL